MAKDHEDGAETTAAGACASPARAPARPSRRPLNAAARDRIGRGLRLHYDQVLALPIPDHLRALLDDLTERAERESPR